MADLATHHRWDELPREELNPLLGRRLITGGDMMIAHVYLKKGCIVPMHEHHNEQLTYVLDGALRTSGKGSHVGSDSASPGASSSLAPSSRIAAVITSR